ncbi:putative DNA-directed RNA polymerase II subunit RPB11 [Blattamonas nauphoetae]|uniref:DNA-directed RNA polymerase II subunit RPB11 n=1 Tax=Blattamonas nauphoetae TaxID=2049346 RepID=A0ABQ9YFC7_9EUKA|nr:putative DNA-directed RNA polymerase II subunit RPB11 [Blattamonas nauphoetae]
MYFTCFEFYAKLVVMNVPGPEELLYLPEGMDKVTCEEDKRVPHCSIFTFHLEDHTLGNLLRMQLLRYPKVKFAAYQIPHPLVNDCILRIQTDGTVTPKVALLQAFDDLRSITENLEKAFDEGHEIFLKRK